MVLKAVSYLTLGLFSFSAFAVDVSRCPVKINFAAKVERVFKKSLYSKTPGWTEAQKTLIANTDIETRYDLVGDKNSNCLYVDQDGNRATLTTTPFRDPEMEEPLLNDQLISNLKIGAADYVIFLPIKLYGRSGLVTYTSPFSVKIKTQLWNADRKRRANYDLGMVAVTVD